MKLVNGILRPGEVLEVLENGKIKASAPGLFSEEDKDLIPPVMPFWELIGSHANTFSTPTEGDEVWILNLTDNPLQLYWFRKDNLIIFGSRNHVVFVCTTYDAIYNAVFQ